MLHEELLPNQICLFCFIEVPELLIWNLEETKSFRYEIMIHQQFINTPKQELAKGRVVKMSVDVIYL